MYCLSKDGLRLVNARNFYVKEIDYATIVTKPHEIKHIILADDCIMDAFNTEEDARKKLKEVIVAVGSGAEVFEF